MISPQEFPPDDFIGMSEAVKKSLCRLPVCPAISSILGALFSESLAIESERDGPGIFEFTSYASTKDRREYAIGCFEQGYVRGDFPTPLPRRSNRSSFCAIGRCGFTHEDLTVGQNDATHYTKNTGVHA